MENVKKENVFDFDTSAIDSQDNLFFENLSWMRTEDAAKYLRTSVGQIRNMVYRGQLRPRKFNRRLYFRKADIDRAIESSRNGAF